jgi:hypothetical protein
MFKDPESDLAGAVGWRQLGTATQPSHRAIWTLRALRRVAVVVGALGGARPGSTAASMVS